MSNREDKNVLFLSITGGFYGVIAGLAATNALTFGFESVMNNLDTLTQNIPQTATWKQISESISQKLYEILMVLSFFVIVVPFFHGAMVFLSDKNNDLIKENSRGLAIHFFSLLLEAILFLGLALVLSSYLFTIILLALIMLVDAIWIILIHRFGNKETQKPPHGWIYLNLSFVVASFFILNFTHMYSEDLIGFFQIKSIFIIQSIFLVGICIARTTIDYRFFLKYYKFGD